MKIRTEMQTKKEKLLADFNEQNKKKLMKSTMSDGSGGQPGRARAKSDGGDSIKANDSYDHGKWVIWEKFLLMRVIMQEI